MSSPELGVEILFLVAREHNVVADDLAVEEQLGVVARDRIEAAAAFDPVVTLIAHQDVDTVSACDEVVALSGEDFRVVHADEDDILATATHEDVDAIRVGDDVVALVTFKEVERVAAVGDDVVTATAVHEIDTGTGFDAIVTVIAPDAVVTEVGDDRVVAARAADNDMFAAREAQEVRFHSVRGGIVALHLAPAERFKDRVVARRIDTRLVTVLVGLVVSVDLQHEVVICKRSRRRCAA